VVFRTEVNVLAREVTQIEQVVYGGGPGEVRVLDKGQKPPAGFKQCGKPPAGFWPGMAASL
jgi:hypothetical protein